MVDLLNDKNILYKLSNSPDVLTFLVNLSPSEYRSLQQLMGWGHTLLNQFVQNPDNSIVLFKAWDYVDDKLEFLNRWLSMSSLPQATKVNIVDAFSIGQLSSKSWLLDQLQLLNITLGNVWILGGWVGSLAYLMFERSQLNITNIRNFDIDNNCAILSESLNQKYLIDNCRFKATTLDVNTIEYINFKYITRKSNNEPEILIETADTIINTSCDHMGDNDAWWNKIPNGKLVILHNNDYVDVNDHDNIVHSIEEFIARYPMNSILYSGVLKCMLYNRYMIIGYK